jgi:formiminoglutamate deiminase
MTVFWCERAVVDGQVLASVRIEEQGGVITSVEEGDREADAIVLPGLVLPGFANGHSHLFHRALRGRTHGGGGTFWTWREEMYRAATALDPDSYRELATAVFAEMVLAGYTVVGEFHYLHHQPDGSPYATPTAMEDAVVEAASIAGIRLTLLDTLYLAGGTGRALLSEQRRFSDGSIAAWVTRRNAVVFGPLARSGAAIHSVRAVPAVLLREAATLSRDRPLHAHVSEQRAENDEAIAAHGGTPTELLAASKVLGPNFTAVHGTHLTEHDIQLLADSHSTVCFCPSTERDLADGIGPATALRDAGTTLSLGSDQNAIVDPFEELRGLEMDERLDSGQRGRFTPMELLEVATSAGYASLGWDGGRIQVGAVCDLVALSLSTPRTAGARPEQAWFAATASDVTDVIVGGEARVRDGHHLLGDVGALLSAAIERLDL